MGCFCEIISSIFNFLQKNASWICAIALAYYAHMQYNIILKQKNLALLEKRLNLKNKLKEYVDEKLKTCLEPKLNVEIFKGSFENMIDMANDAHILFNKDISEKTINLAKELEELKTAIHYNIRKNQGEDVRTLELLSETEKDYGYIHAQINQNKNLLIEKMHQVMQGDKV